MPPPMIAENAGDRMRQCTKSDGPECDPTGCSAPALSDPATLIVARARLLLLLLSRGVRLMAPDDAAGSGAQQPMVASVVAGYTADQRALDAPFGLRHRGRQRDSNEHSDRESCSGADSFHGELRCLNENEDVVG
jgi:hypothetical protein